MLYGFTRRLTSKPKHKGANYENQIHTAQSICKFNATLAFGFYGSETAKTCQSKIVHLHFLHFVYDLFGAEKIDFLKIEEKKKTILLTPEKISVCIFGTDTPKLSEINFYCRAVNRIGDDFEKKDANCIQLTWTYYLEMHLNVFFK